MNRLFSAVAKKVSSFVASFVLVALAASPAIVNAWSPERPTYTIENPAPHVTFNSITNNPDEGDERAFFEVKDASNTQSNGFSHSMTGLKDGQELLMRVYVHNNAAENLNTQPDGQGGFKGIARNTKVRIHLPTATAPALRANAYITADNAQPGEVADTIDLEGLGAFSLEYVAGSAIQYTNAVPAGMKLNDSIVTTGALIGYDQPNGTIPGCFQYDGIVTIKVKVKSPAHTVAKSVRLDGQGANDWKESVTTTPGQTVEWRIAFNNTGSTQLNEVVVVDQIPAGLTVVPGSIRLKNAKNPNGIAVTDQAIQANGRQINVNIGSYTAGSNAFLYFKTRALSAEELKCGSKKLVNTAYATPEGSGSVNDTAEVVVDSKKECADKPASLPKTGPGDVAGLFLATTVAGAVAHRYIYARRSY